MCFLFILNQPSVQQCYQSKGSNVWYRSLVVKGHTKSMFFKSCGNEDAQICRTWKEPLKLMHAAQVLLNIMIFLPSSARSLQIWFYQTSSHLVFQTYTRQYCLNMYLKVKQLTKMLWLWFHFSQFFDLLLFAYKSYYFRKSHTTILPTHYSYSYMSCYIAILHKKYSCSVLSYRAALDIII